MPCGRAQILDMQGPELENDHHPGELWELRYGPISPCLYKYTTEKRKQVPKTAMIMHSTRRFGDERQSNTRGLDKKKYQIVYLCGHVYIGRTFWWDIFDRDPPAAKNFPPHFQKSVHR